MKKILEWMVAVVAIIGLALPLISKAKMAWAFYHLGYWIETALVVSWGTILFIFLKDLDWQAYRKSILAFTLSSLIGVAVITATNPLEMKIHSDDACILSTANSLYINQTSSNITEAKYYFDNFYPINTEAPVRPLLFPYLIQIFHRIMGMGEHSVYALNLTIAFFFLLLTQLLFYVESKSIVSSLAGGLFLFSLPLFQMFSTAGGFDLASCFFLFLSIWIGALAMRTPTDRLISLFILTLTLFSQVRYEGPMIAAVLGLYFLIQTPEKLKFMFRWESFLLVGSLSIHLWQRVLTPDLLQSPADRSVFSAQNFLENSHILIQSLFQMELPFNPLFTLLAIPAAVFALTYRKLAPHRKTIAFVVIGVAVPTLFTLSVISGIYNTPSNTRYFFPIAIGTLILIPFLSVFTFRIRTAALLAIAVSNWALFGLNSSHYAFLNTLTLNRDMHYLYDFVKKQNSKRILVVFDRPVQFAAIGVGAMTFARAKNEIASLQQELKNHLYDHVFLFEETTYTDQDKRWTADAKVFTPVTYFQQYGNHVMHVSELK